MNEKCISFPYEMLRRRLRPLAERRGNYGNRKVKGKNWLTFGEMRTSPDPGLSLIHI